MRFALMLALTATFAGADTLSNPTFGQAGTNCVYSGSSPYTTSTCPVIGDPTMFDIQSITVSMIGSQVTATINFNYGGNIHLDPYLDFGILLQPGDLFFYDPNDPTEAKQFGVAIDSARPHSNDFIAGDLYRIDGTIISLETAQDALNNPNAYYRKDQQVLMVDTAGTPAVAGLGAGVTVAALGNGITAADYSATVQFDAPADFLSLFHNGQIGVDFASADCGNAVLGGDVSPAPEPGSVLLMACCAGLVGLAGYRRAKTSRSKAAITAAR